eukprot:4309902-Pyramimonas_sp.AAC.1
MESQEHQGAGSVSLKVAPACAGALASAAGTAAVTSSSTAMPWVSARTYGARPSRPAWARVNWPRSTLARFSRPLR